MWAYWTALGAGVAAAMVACYTDWTRREIPNWLTGGLFLLGVLLWGARGTVAGGPYTGMLFAAHSLGGAVADFLVFLLFYVLGAMEMGDVKYMAAVGALVGWPWAVMALIYVALVGAVEAVVYSGIEGTLGRTLRNLWTMMVSWLVPGRERVTAEDVETSTLPYGIAIAIGSVWTLLAMRFPEIRLFW